MKQITKFWSWFQDNEDAIKNALLLGINTKEVFHHLKRNLNYVSKRIGFMIKAPNSNNNKCLIIFTGEGYRKLFPKLIALEEQAPRLELFYAQAFIKPMEKVQQIILGKDNPYTFENYKIKISDLQMLLLDYNIGTKQLKIKIFIKNYNEIKHFEELQTDIKFMLMEIIGEINYRKHIKKIEFFDLPEATNGLLSLIELPDYIDYLYKINSRQKTRVI
jgi:hypothetical protein